MIKKVEPLSEIQRFYEGSNVFVTGATGFIGNLLIEKLLRYIFIFYICSI
jgi:fatty acyl-CoA reductase